MSILWIFFLKMIKPIGSELLIIVRFSDPNEAYYYDTQVINDNIINKKEYSHWIDKFDSVGNDFVYVFMSSLFYAKSKSLSHLRESIMFYKDAIISIVNGKDQQYNALEALSDVWCHSSIYMCFLFDNLLKLSFVDYLVTTKWLFDKLLKEYTNIPNKFIYFDLLDILVSNCSNSIARIQKELSKEQESLAKSEESFQSNIIKNIETYEENLEKQHDIEKKLYNEVVFVISYLFRNLFKSIYKLSN